jgi:N-acetylglucosamine kinase-like BadF-type ATPase
VAVNGMAPHDGGAAPTLDGRLPDILAVDGGNSKVDIALVRADGAVLGVARGAGTPLMPGTEERSLAALVDAVARACSQAGIDGAQRPVARTAVLCVCGADLPVDDRRILRALKPLRLAGDLLLRNDTFAVLRAGTERSWGVGVVCGAGMNCAAVGPDGRIVRFASLGEISGDDGGGGWLGRQAVRAAVRGRDGRGPHTALERLVPEHCGVRTIQAVLEAIQTGRITEYPADLAPVVFAAAEDGDGVAQALVDHQADELVAMVASALRRLRLTRRDVHVVLGGGIVAGGGDGFVGRIAGGIHAVAPAADVRRLEVPPIVGAALLGCDRLGTAHRADLGIRAALTGARLASTVTSQREA